MSDTPPTDPLLASILAAVRYAVGLGTTYLIGKGVITLDQVPGILTAAAAAATVGYGIWKTHSRQQKLVDASPGLK